MNKFAKLMTVALLLSVFCYPLAAGYAAGVPHMISYQGRLTDKNNKTLDGSYVISFRIFDAPGATVPIWEEVQDSPAVVVQKGIFNTLIGSQLELNLPFDKQYYLEIKVGEEIMKPRQKLASSGYAIRAERAEKAETAEGTIKATGGLIIETRTSDPASPATGQMWLRTDL